MRNSFPIVVSLLMAAVLLSCSMPAKQEQIVAEERKLPVEDMIDIFYEMHKADAILTLNLVKVNGHTDLTDYQVDSILYDNIYDRHNCTRESFEESVLWYLQNEPMVLRSLYEEVVERCNQELISFEQQDKEK